MRKRSKMASTQEVSFELSEEAHDALLEELRKTQWVDRVPGLHGCATICERLGCPAIARQLPPRCNGVVAGACDVER